jgi:hypothetical protein
MLDLCFAAVAKVLRRSRQSATSTAVVGALIVSTGSFTQSDAVLSPPPAKEKAITRDVAELVVTVQERNQNQQSVPVAVTAITP